MLHLILKCVLISVYCWHSESVVQMPTCQADEENEEKIQFFAQQIYFSRHDTFFLSIKISSQEYKKCLADPICSKYHKLYSNLHIDHLTNNISPKKQMRKLLSLLFIFAIIHETHLDFYF